MLRKIVVALIHPRLIGGRSLRGVGVPMGLADSSQYCRPCLGSVRNHGPPDAPSDRFGLRRDSEHLPQVTKVGSVVAHVLGGCV